VYSEKKRLEKLDTMHNNPVKRGLVASPGLWPWSSWRFYYLNDQSVLSMDRLPWHLTSPESQTLRVCASPRFLVLETSYPAAPPAQPSIHLT